MKRTARYLVITLSTLLSVLTPAYGESYVVGVEDVSYYPHFNFRGRNKGFARVMLEKFAKDNGHTFTYSPVPLESFDTLLTNDEIDFKYPDNIRWKDPEDPNTKIIHFSEEIIQMAAGTVVLAHNAHRPLDFFKNIGIIAGFQPTSWKQRIAQGRTRLIENTSPFVLANLLVNGVVDGLYIAPSVVEFSLRKINKSTGIAFNDAQPLQSFSYQLSTIQHPEMILEFNHWLTANRNYLLELKQQFGIVSMPQDRR